VLGKSFLGSQQYDDGRQGAQLRPDDEEGAGALLATGSPKSALEISSFLVSIVPRSQRRQ